jgi:hypothetical protein
MVGNAFTHSYSDWRDGTYENFKEWAVKQFGLKDLDSDDNADVPVDMQKAKDIVFKKNKKGVYILPEMADFKTIRQKQRVVRGYIGAVYSAFFFNSYLFWFAESNDRRLHWQFKISIPLQSVIKG